MSPHKCGPNTGAASPRITQAGPPFSALCRGLVLLRHTLSNSSLDIAPFHAVLPQIREPDHPPPALHAHSVSVSLSAIRFCLPVSVFVSLIHIHTHASMHARTNVHAHIGIHKNTLQPQRAPQYRSRIAGPGFRGDPDPAARTAFLASTRLGRGHKRPRGAAFVMRSTARRGDSRTAACFKAHGQEAAAAAKAAALTAAPAAMCIVHPIRRGWRAGSMWGPVGVVKEAILSAPVVCGQGSVRDKWGSMGRWEEQRGPFRRCPRSLAGPAARAGGALRP